MKNNEKQTKKNKYNRIYLLVHKFEVEASNSYKYLL